MTYDERIEAMARMMCYTHWAEVLSNYYPSVTAALDTPDIYAEENWRNCVSEAAAALAAAGVEDMVREAAQRGWEAASSYEGRHFEVFAKKREAIVREVMGK